MKKETLVTTNIKCSTEKINNETHLKLTFNGLSKTNVLNYVYDLKNQKETELYIPMWCLPYIQKEQAKSIVKWSENENEFINNVKNSFNQKL